MQHQVRINWGTSKANRAENPPTVGFRYFDGGLEITLTRVEAEAASNDAAELLAFKKGARDVLQAARSFVESLPFQPPEAGSLLFSEKLGPPLAELASLLVSNGESAAGDEQGNHRPKEPNP